MFKKTNTVRVPRNLGSVTQIDTKAEKSPYDVSMTRDNVEAIWSSVESFYRTGLQPGMTMVLRRQGEVVLKRSIGHAKGNPPPQHEGEEGTPVLMHPDTPICLFSASKAITAMLIHKLQEQGRLNVKDKVASYIPEFGTNGKENITIEQILAHRGGIPMIPMKNPHPQLLMKWDSVIDMINSGYTDKGDGSEQAYHAIVGGYVLGEVVQRITNKTCQQYLSETISKPLGAEYLTYGLPEHQQEQSASNYSTGAQPVFPINILAKRALGIDFEQIATISNSADFMKSIIPAGNMYGSADDVSKFYQMMLNGGEFNNQQVFEKETINQAIKPVGPLTIDRTLMIPMRFSQGFMLGENLFSLFGIKASKAFGHLGLINIVTWADPAREISVSFLNTGKSLDPRTLPALGKILFAVSQNCSVLKH